MKRIPHIIIAVIMLLGTRAFAADAPSSEEPTSLEILEEIRQIEAEEFHYAFPSVKPEFSLSGGYRFVGLTGSTRADEYEYLHDSLMLGGEMHFFSFPHRFSLDLDIKNKKDYFGDTSYSYKDLVLFRGINRTLYHNLDTIKLIDLDPSTPSPGVDVKDPDEIYGVKFSMTTAFLRLKMPDFPFHVYFDGTLIERDGSQQLHRADLTSSVARTSQSRDIDWKTKSILIGANSHVGPVEIDFAHGEKRFEADGDNVIYGPYRSHGDFPVNQISDLKSSSNTLKLHTSYTGGLVATATLSKTDKENRDNGASADHFIGAGEIVWTASPRLSVFVKYRHKDIDVDTPSTVTISDRTDPMNSYTFAVKPAVSSQSDVVSGLVRYRPLSGVTLRGEFTYEDIRRDDPDAWNLPHSTERYTASMAADIRVAKGLSVKAQYLHREIVDPAYNTDPDHADEARISVSWVPLTRLSALVRYSMIREKRDNIFFDVTESADSRKVQKDNFLGSVTFQALQNLSLTAGYSYMHHKIKQDIAFHDDSGGVLTDSMVPNKDTVQHVSVDMNYLPKDFLSITAGISYTQSKGDFYPSAEYLTVPVPISSFTSLKTRETIFSASGEYRFMKGFAASVEYKYCDFNDVIENPYDDVNDGEAHIIMLTLSKKW